MASESPWRLHAEMQLARLYRGWTEHHPRPLPAAPRPSFCLHSFGEAPQANPQPIPRRVWAFWGGGEPPLVVARCLAGWQRVLPGWDIQIVSPGQIARWLDREPPADLLNGQLAKLADWLRLELLHRHGGIWLDASTILTESLQWVIDAQQGCQADFVGFWLGRYTQDPAFPIIENWFLAAPPGSPFIAALREAYREAVALGGDAYVQRLQQRPDYTALLQGIDMPAYLSQHLAMQVVLRSGTPCRLALMQAEQGPFFYHQQARWRRTGLKQHLLFSRPRHTPPDAGAQDYAPMIKLRGPDRRKLDAYLGQHCFIAGSMADRFLR